MAVHCRGSPDHAGCGCGKQNIKIANGLFIPQQIADPPFLVAEDQIDAG